MPISARAKIRQLQKSPLEAKSARFLDLHVGARVLSNEEKGEPALLIRSLVSSVLILFAAFAVAAYAFNLPYWAMKPQEKFATEWRNDLSLLQKSGKLPKEWDNLSDVEFTSNDTQVQDWYQKTKSPFSTKKDGAYKLQVLAVHFIEGHRYGVMLQYNWIENKSGNTVGELSRRMKLGIYY
jgi:hypothetical protein